MASVDSIFTWVKARYDKPWHEAAFHLSASMQAVQESDAARLDAMVKAAAGLGTAPVSPPGVLVAAPPAPPPLAPTVLLRMRNLRSVNALAPDQVIEFKPAGLTVIYGENGTGKSGYSRVLRSACRRWRTKDVEPILPDVRESDSSTPEATFDVAVGAQELSVIWRQGETPPPELSSLAVFDGKCVEGLLADENAPAYEPAILRILARFAALVTDVSARVSPVIASLRRFPASLEALDGPGEVGDWIKELRTRRPSRGLDEVVGNPEAARARIEQINRDLALSASTSGPEAEAKRLDGLRVRLAGLRGRLEVVLAEVGSDAEARVVERVQDVLAKREAAAEASKLAFDGSFLPGTGGGPWRQLFAAAREFSVAAYPGQPFPFTGTGSRCPLCQQDLGREAAVRLRRFNAFVADRSAQDLRTAEKALADDIRRLQATQVPVVDEDLDSAVFQWGLKTDINDLRDFAAALAARRLALLAACETTTPPANLNPVDGSLLAETAGVESRLATEAAAKAALVQPTAKLALEGERRALEERLNLWDKRADVIEYLKNANAAEKLQAALGRTDTGPLSAENRRLGQEVVTSALSDALNEELQRLGADQNLAVELKVKGRDGEPRNYIALKGTSTSKRELLRVLSEGEQRVLGFAAFLAELSLANEKVGVIVDDPVTSLDHRWSERCAERLVELSKGRQVVVFTHDVSFLLHICETAILEDVPVRTVSLTRRDSTPGYCSNRNWHTMSVGDRIKHLEEMLPKLDELYKHNPSSEEYGRKVNEFAGHLRACWERAIEFEMFQKSVVRFRTGVQPGRLAGAVIDAELYRAVMAGWTRLSAQIDAHDRASGRTPTRWDPATVRAEMRRLTTFIGEVRKKREIATNERVRKLDVLD